MIRRRERGFVRSLDMILFTALMSIVGVSAWLAHLAGKSWHVGFYAASVVVGIVGGIVASVCIVGGYTDDMGPGCAVAALCVIGAAIGGGLAARSLSDGGLWLGLAGTFGGVFVVSMLGLVIKNLLIKPEPKA